MENVDINVHYTGGKADGAAGRKQRRGQRRNPIDSVGSADLLRLIVNALCTFEYDGNPHAASVKLSGKLEAGKSYVDRMLYNGEKQAPVNTGNYTVTCRLVLPAEQEAVTLISGKDDDNRKAVLAAGDYPPNIGRVNPRRRRYVRLTSLVMVAARLRPAFFVSARVKKLL